ncbi:MAG: DNA repair protein RecN [Pseudomonadota bacterium]
MLQGLAIRDVVLIDRLDLAFESGLSVMTGETGAGKSILLDALGLALGARADAALVRKGAVQAAVSATFEPPTGHPVHADLAERGLGKPGEGPLILRRILSADGRSRAFVNDQPVSVAALRELGRQLVEIHGQFESQGLLDPGTHRQALDAFGGLAAEVLKVAAAHAAWRRASSAEAKAREEAAKAKVDEDYLRHALAEIEGLDPRPGEEQDLARKRAMLAARDKLVEALGAAMAELGAHKGVEGALRSAQRQLERAADKATGELSPAIAALDRAAIEAAEATALLGRFGAALEIDAGALERAEERLFALRAAARKHRIEVDRLAELGRDIARRLAAIDDQAGESVRLAAESARAKAEYVAVAAGLSAAREAAARRLDDAVAGELPPLKLGQARFRTRLEPVPEAAWGRDGTDAVAFEVATNPGADFGPLQDIASGGELARLTLALKVVLAGTGSAPTLIFDEVDSGIGGAAAAAVGERLARLARDIQVLAVTHSPQGAARGHHHWRVVKRPAGEGVVTAVEALDAAARREEIARLLSGARITDAARAAADSLLGKAGRAPGWQP